MMTLAAHTLVAPALAPHGGVVPESWSLGNLFSNGTALLKTLGGAFLGLVGLVCIICAVVFIAQKLLSEQSRRSWITIILLLVFGGAMITGGITLFVSIASGGKSTIDQLGGGLILLGLWH